MTEATSDNDNAKGILLPSLVVGLCLGWLVGLSVSAVVGGVISALLAIVGGASTALYTVTKETRPDAPKFDLWPLAILSLGIAMGSTCGLYARGQGWFASDDPARRAEELGSGGLYNASQSSCDEFRQAVLIGSRSDLLRVLSTEFGEFGQTLASLPIEEAAMISVGDAICGLDSD